MAGRWPCLIAVLVMVVSVTTACPTNQTVYAYCKCEDSHSGVMLDCSGHPANETVPVLRFNQAQLGLIQELNMRQANLRRLDSRFFKGLYVKKLDLSFNDIEKIEDDAFYGMETVLQSLLITHNNLTELPSAALGGMSALLTLDLSNNSIADLENRQAFRNVPKLYDLNLANNRICDVQKAVFDDIKDTIQTLNLGRNCLKTVPASAIRGFKQILALHLHNNEIAILEPLAFMNLPLLNLINLAGNQIRSMHRQAFLNVPNLRLMYLSENRLSEVTPNQFRHFEMLEMLDLTRNLIERLPKEAFANMPRLNQLYLGENRIAKMERDAFLNSSIVILLMPSNHLTTLTADMLDGLENVQQLSLKDNEIESIDQNAFYNMASLVMIDLSNNRLLDLQPATFLAQLNMFLVDLSGNKLLRTPYGAFNRRVMTVVLQENPLVCTERVHMLQQGVGVYVPGTIDHVCGGVEEVTSPIDVKPTANGAPAPPNAPNSAPAFVQGSTVSPPQSIIRPGSIGGQPPAAFNNQANNGQQPGGQAALPTAFSQLPANGIRYPPTLPENNPGLNINPILPQVTNGQQLPPGFPSQLAPGWFGQSAQPSGLPPLDLNNPANPFGGLPPTNFNGGLPDSVLNALYPNASTQIEQQWNTQLPSSNLQPGAPDVLSPSWFNSFNQQPAQPGTNADPNGGGLNSTFTPVAPQTAPRATTARPQEEEEDNYPRTIRPFPVPFLSQGPKMHQAFLATTTPPKPTLPPGIVIATAYPPPDQMPEWTQPSPVLESAPPPAWTPANYVTRNPERPWQETYTGPSSPQQAVNSQTAVSNAQSTTPIAIVAKTVPTKKSESQDHTNIALGEMFPYESTEDKSQLSGGPGNATTTIVVCLSAVAIVMIGVFITLCVVRHRSQTTGHGASSSSSSSAAARTSAYVAAQAAQMNFAASNYGTASRMGRPASSLGHPTANNGHTWIYTPGSYTSASNYYANYPTPPRSSETGTRRASTLALLDHSGSRDKKDGGKGCPSQGHQSSLVGRCRRSTLASRWSHETMERALLLLVLAPVALAFCPGFLKDQTACSCFAYVDGAVIKCSGPDGPTVVEQLKTVQTEIRELAIENANIVEIGPRAFRNLRIKKLVLDNNRIKAIHADAFRGLESTMQELSLSFNKLTEIPTDALLGMRNLMVLNLKCNQIGDIYGSAFRNVTNLIELNLACNQICKVQGPAFHEIKDTLQSLILDQNCLQEIPAEALRNFENLLALHVQYNQIASVEKLQLMNLTSLLMLRLTGNKIRSVDKNGMSNVPNLRYLYLNQNELSSIVPGIFQQFKFLEIIDMSSNNIGEIATDTFSGLEHLMQLNLEGNAIKDVASGAFSSTPLLLLMLGGNCLSSVNQNMFQGVPFLRQLSLGNNNIRLVAPLSFSHLANLHLLDLSHNKMQVVQPGALTASQHVTVMLQENPLVCSQDGYHIVQGGQAIHLLNEPNLVCQTDFTRDDKDVCPTRKDRPAPPPCCQALKNVTTPSPLSLTTGAAVTPAGTNQVGGVPQVANGFVPSVLNTPRSRAVNMERFWRLSRRPTGTIRPDTQVPNFGVPTQVQQPQVPQPQVPQPQAAAAASPLPPSTLQLSAIPPQSPILNIQSIPPPQTMAGPQPPAAPAPPGAAAPPAPARNIPPQQAVDPNDPFQSNRGPFLPDSGVLAGQRPAAPGVNQQAQAAGGVQPPTGQPTNSFVRDPAAPATAFVQPSAPNVQQQQQQPNTFVQPSVPANSFGQAPIPANQAVFNRQPPPPPLQPNFLTTVSPQVPQQQQSAVPARVQARQQLQQQQQGWTPQQQQALEVQQQWLQQWPRQPLQQPQEQWQWPQQPGQTTPPPQQPQQPQWSTEAPTAATQLPQASTSVGQQVVQAAQPVQPEQTQRERARLPVRRLSPVPASIEAAQQVQQQAQVQTTRVPQQQTQLPDQLHSQLPPWIVTENKTGKDESVSFNTDAQVQRVAVDQRPTGVRTAAKH
uniref:Leucine-rich repeat-containing protein let-4 n=1 Tax=Plectus sambesii TaxID=2011161 RepID=A0A914WNM6_9BILA